MAKRICVFLLCVRFGETPCPWFNSLHISGDHHRTWANPKTGGTPQRNVFQRSFHCFRQFLTGVHVPDHLFDTIKAGFNSMIDSWTLVMIGQACVWGQKQRFPTTASPGCHLLYLGYSGGSRSSSFIYVYGQHRNGFPTDLKQTLSPKIPVGPHPDVHIH